MMGMGYTWSTPIRFVVAPSLYVKVEDYSPKQPVAGEEVTFRVRVGLAREFNYDTRVEAVMAVGGSAKTACREDNIVDRKQGVIWAGSSNGTMFEFKLKITKTVYVCFGAKVISYHPPVGR